MSAEKQWDDEKMSKHSDLMFVYIHVAYMAHVSKDSQQ